MEYEAAQRFSVAPAEIHQECKKPHSLNLFASLLLGDVMEYPFPETHVAYWALLVNAVLAGDERELRYALGLPRGFAKTTLIKLFVCWLLIYTDHRFILVVSSTTALAKNVLRDVVLFMSTPNFRAVWGNWDAKIEMETKEDVRFLFLGKTVIIQAIGAESSVRGVNVDNERPSVIVCEDAQTRESAESEVQNSAFINWFLGTLVKARSYRKSLIVYIGNMYNERCLLNQLRLNPEWTSLVTSAILANGRSIWPDFRPVSSLLKEYRGDNSMGKGYLFLAEVMNDPKAMAGGWVDLTKVQPYQFPELDKENSISGYFIIVDPATGKKKGDDTAVGVIAVLNGKAVVRHVTSGKWNDEDTVKVVLRLALEWQCSLLVVEDVAYQVALINYLEREMRRLRITGIQVAGISPKGIPKAKRIQTAMLKWITKEIDVHPDARPLVLAQISDFSPAQTDNVDDILDVLGYADPALQENWQFLYLKNSVQDEDSVGVAGEEVTNCF